MSQEDIKVKLRRFICTELLKKPSYPLRDDEELITSGLIESFSLAMVGVFIEIEFNAYLPDTELTVDRMNTVNEMASRVWEKLQR